MTPNKKNTNKERECSFCARTRAKALRLKQAAEQRLKEILHKRKNKDERQ